MQALSIRVPRLLELVRSHFRDVQATLHPWKGGADFAVYLVRSRGREYVLRTPHDEVVETRYEGSVDFAAVIVREVEAHRCLSAAGIPVPALIDHDISRATVPWSWMLVARAPGAVAPVLTAAQATSLGALAKRIHSIESVSPILDVAGPDWPSFVIARIVKRIEAASRYFVPPGTPDEWRARLAAHIPAHPQRALLHLDLRPDNVHVDGANIVSVLDYSNALIGDPWFELARISVSGLLDAPFLAGYGLAPGELEAHANLLNAYALDTSALLCVVAGEETHDPELHARMIELTQRQLTQLLSRR